MSVVYPSLEDCIVSNCLAVSLAVDLDGSSEFIAPAKARSKHAFETVRIFEARKLYVQSLQICAEPDPIVIERKKAIGTLVA